MTVDGSYKNTTAGITKSVTHAECYLAPTANKLLFLLKFHKLEENRYVFI